MQIKFKKLELQNFKSHQELTVNFGERTVIAGDNAKGKSSIGEAITFLLYGTDLLGSKLDPTPDTYEADATSVTLTIDNDGNELILQRSIVKGRNKFAVNEVPSKATEFNETVEMLFEKEQFLSLFNPSYFFTMHWEKQRAMVLQYVTAPTNKEVIKGLPGPQADKLGELVKKQSLENLNKIHRENKTKKEQEYIAAQSRTKTLKDELDTFGGLVPLESLHAEKKQLEKERTELEKDFDDNGDKQHEINRLMHEIDMLTMQIDKGRAEHTALKGREIDANCHECGQELQDESKQQLLDNKEKQLQDIAASVNPLIKERKELRDRVANIDIVVITDDVRERVRVITDEIHKLDYEINKHGQIESLEERISEAKQNEEDTKKSLNESIFILDAIKAFNAKEAELQATKVQNLLETLSIRLFDEVKSTGELKPTFVVQMDGKDYNKLSLSESIRAGLELRDVLSEQSGLIAPVFVDNSESITRFKEPNGQLIMAKVVAGKDLEILDHSEVEPIGESS